MASAQQNRGAIDVTPTTTNKEEFNGQRHNYKYLFVLSGVLIYSIHMQFFSQNQSLFSPI